MKFTILLAALFAIAAAPVSALACACCAETGTYLDVKLRPEQLTANLLSELRFDSQADLFTTEAGFDMIKGLDPVRPEYDSGDWTAQTRFGSRASLNGQTWRFDYTTPKGQPGSLVFPMPVRLELFKADIRDDENRPNGPLLYKEIRLRGTVSSATGFTRAGWRRGTTYFLLFQGRGAGCDEPSDFTNWRLEISGPRADYAFHGKLAPPVESSPD